LNFTLSGRFVDSCRSRSLCLQRIDRFLELQEELHELQKRKAEEWKAMSEDERQRRTRKANFPVQPPILMPQSLPVRMARDEAGHSDACLVLGRGRVDTDAEESGGRRAEDGGDLSAKRRKLDITDTPPSHPIVNRLFEAWRTRGGDANDSESGTRPWCFDLLLDVMHGIHTWDVEEDRDEWWMTDPACDFPSVNFAPACAIGGYLFNGIGSTLLDEFCGALERDASLQERLDTLYALRQQFPHSHSVKAGLAALYLYWRVEALLAQNDHLRTRLK